MVVFIANTSRAGGGSSVAEFEGRDYSWKDLKFPDCFYQLLGLVYVKYILHQYDEEIAEYYP